MKLSVVIFSLLSMTSTASATAFSEVALGALVPNGEAGQAAVKAPPECSLVMVLRKDLVLKPFERTIYSTRDGFTVGDLPIPTADRCKIVFRNSPQDKSAESRAAVKTYPARHPFVLAKISEAGAVGRYLGANHIMFYTDFSPGHDAAIRCEKNGTEPFSQEDVQLILSPFAKIRFNCQ